MTTPEPLVTIILPTFNRAHLIGESIQSVLDQTYQNWELIVADDGSADNTEEVVRSFNDPRVSYHFFEHTGIIDQFRNFGIRSSRGDLIAFLDSDDLWLPEKTATQVRLLLKYPLAAFSFTHGYEFGEQQTHFHSDVFRARNQPDENVFTGRVFEQLLGDGYMSYLPSLMFRKSVVGQVGFMDESLKSCFGFEFSLRLAANFDGVAINEKLVRIRKHRQGVSVLRQGISYDTNSAILLKYYRSGHLSKRKFQTHTGELWYKAGMFHLRNHNGKKALRYFKEYIYLRPLRINGWIRFLQSVFRNYTFRIYPAPK
jgi:glycosyltransferase involved in cell wall biosynthesis